jgi:ring-1,2-phenylacetyl-CoA epoxidase subunit PaaB
MEFKSHDPRVNRLKLVRTNESFDVGHEMDQWQTWEVFHQQARGDQHRHVGIVHAPTAEMALLFAKEQYARRMKCVNLWVVRTADVYASEYEDSDMFEPAFDKSYRESFGYTQTRARIDEFRKAQGLAATTTAEPPAVTSPAAPKTTVKKAGIVIGKKK